MVYSLLIRNGKAGWVLSTFIRSGPGAYFDRNQFAGGNLRVPPNSKHAYNFISAAVEAPPGAGC